MKRICLLPMSFITDLSPNLSVNLRAFSVKLRVTAFLRS